MQSHTISYHPIRSHNTSSKSHTISCHLMQSHTISYNLIQSHTISYNLIQSHTISCHLMQSHTMSYNLIRHKVWGGREYSISFFFSLSSFLSFSPSSYIPFCYSNRRLVASTLFEFFNLTFQSQIVFSSSYSNFCYSLCIF